MATRADIVDRLARRRVASVYLPGLTRVQIRQAAQQLTDEEWDAIITGVRTGDAEIIGNTIRRQTLGYLKALAVADVEAALAPDDTLSVTELEGLI